MATLTAVPIFQVMDDPNVYLPNFNSNGGKEGGWRPGSNPQTAQGPAARSPAGAVTDLSKVAGASSTFCAAVSGNGTYAGGYAFFFGMTCAVRWKAGAAAPEFAPVSFATSPMVVAVAEDGTAILRVLQAGRFVLFVWKADGAVAPFNLGAIDHVFRLEPDGPGTYRMEAAQFQGVQSGWVAAGVSL